MAYLKAYRKKVQPLEKEAATKLAQVAKQERTQYDRLIKQSLKLQNRVAKILCHLSFDASILVITPLWLAVQYYQKKSGRIGKRSPIAFLTEAEKTELNARQIQKKPWKSLYKTLLYIHVAEALKAGTISPFPAYRYLSLEYYLYQKKQWLIHKTRLLEEFGLTGFQDCSATLNVLKEMLHASYERTNQHIQSGENKFVKFNNKGQIIVTTPKVEKINTQPVSALLKENKDISILQILSDIQAHTDYLSCFRHHSVKDKKIMPKPALFYAAILSLGCNIGIPKMAHVSKGISEDSLANVVNWHISIENIRAASQKILGVIDQLSLSSLYKNKDDQLHTASDGMREGVSVPSLNASHSFKYFGHGVGSTVYSFIDNLNRLFYTTVVSSAERDAAYVVDGLLGNLAIKSSIHSTDTHGYSEMLFGVLHFLGIYFAPRIKNMKKSVLYGFKDRSFYEAKGYKVLPTRHINEKHIEELWDDMLRLIVTLKCRDVTASLIFKRLSSYAKQHPLYQAHKEFGRITKSIYILDCIDDVLLRQGSEKRLNRIELSNKFGRAISFGNNQEIQYSSKEEQELVVGCRELLQNIIVLWNELYLSQKIMNTKDPAKRITLLLLIRNGSTLLWQHINFQGEYDFIKVLEKAFRLFDIVEILAWKIEDILD